MRGIGRLELIAFVSGFSLMAFELVAARLLAPSVGSSTYVWTSVIGIIIAALSLGYWLGGRIADARHTPVDIAWVLIAAAFSVGAAGVLYVPVTGWVVNVVGDARLQAVLAASLLFAPTSFLLGGLSPYLARLNVRSLNTAGRAVANLGALNSIGGIVGTFVTGFILFGYVGAMQTLAIIVWLLLGASWLMVWRYQFWVRLGASGLCLLLLVVPGGTTGALAVIDTPSARYSILEGKYNNRPFRGITTGPSGIQSGIYTDATANDELAFWYTREMARLAIAETPQRILMLGGGAFTLPQYLATKLPNSQIDVVEIDPALLTISKQYFDYRQPKNVRLIFDDARRYLERNQTTYNVILVDVYGDGQIPFSLMTAEYAQTLAKRLQPGGILVSNVITGFDNGACQRILAGFDQIYRPLWPHAWYSTDSPKTARGNYVLRYSQRAAAPTGMRPLPVLSGPRYTDNFAPAERLYQECEAV